jgi:LmbE family N-acetylglucosaminyl deacetylase
LLDARVLAVISPHLDDAALSLGGALAAAARHGVSVVVVTVFAGDPESLAPAGAWDSRCGFQTEGDAARVRRAEDARACDILGARPVWLPFKDESYAMGERPTADAIEAAVANADTVFFPGLPLRHPDHALVSSWAGRFASSARVGFYLEQPYLIWEVVGALRRAPRLRLQARLALASRRARLLQEQAIAAVDDDRRCWGAAPASAADRRLKRRAVRAYASQFPHLGRPLVHQIALWERSFGGEGIAWAAAAP